MKRWSCALGVVGMGVCVWVSVLGGVARAQQVPEKPPFEEGAPDEPAAPVPATPPAPAPTPPPAAPVAPSSGVAPGGISLFGELLFLKPTLDDTYFAIRSPAAGTFPNAPSGQRVNDDFEYEPAFRIGAGYEFPETGRAVELSYTRFDENASESVAGNFLWATRGSPNFTFTFGGNTGGYAGTASAEIDAQYQKIDLHGTQPWHVSGLDVGLQLGFEWADFRIGEDYAYIERVRAGSAASRRLRARGGSARRWASGSDTRFPSRSGSRVGSRSPRGRRSGSCSARPTRARAMRSPAPPSSRWTTKRPRACSRRSTRGSASTTPFRWP